MTAFEQGFRAGYVKMAEELGAIPKTDNAPKMDTQLTKSPIGFDQLDRLSLSPKTRKATPGNAGMPLKYPRRKEYKNNWKQG